MKMKIKKIKLDKIIVIKLFYFFVMIYTKTTPPSIINGIDKLDNVDELLLIRLLAILLCVLII